MIKLIVGGKGSGKTKRIIDLVKNAAEEEKGNVVCVVKGTSLNFDIPYSVRLINVEDYVVDGYDGLFGFISGLHAGNYDISCVFIDSVYKIVDDADPAKVEKFMDRLESFAEKHSVKFTVSVSEAEEVLSDGLKKYL